jgi:beta-lactamase class A
MARGILLLASVLVALALGSPQRASAGWDERRDAAARYLQDRAGIEGFAFVTDRGRLHGYRRAKRAPSASLMKAMLLVAYLNRDSVRGRALTDADRNLLRPMIRWSDNVTATRVLAIVGSGAMYRVARRARMRDFSLRSPWGLSLTSARDQAVFFYRIDRLVPRRHRPFALYQLRAIVPSQRWGIPPAKPSGWRIHFKGGWGSGTGRVTHQSALLRRRRSTTRLSLAVITEWNPNHAYGTRTIRGVARRILRTPLPLAP